MHEDGVGAVVDEVGGQPLGAVEVEPAVGGERGHHGRHELADPVGGGGERGHRVGRGQANSSREPRRRWSCGPLAYPNGPPRRVAALDRLGRRGRPREVLVLWHVVRFELGHLDEDTRADLERQLAALVDLDVVRFLRLGRDVEDPAVTGLLVGLDDAAALAVYRDHPDHQPVVARVRELGVTATRLDVLTDDEPGALA
ncbi:hypothetical protein FTX61_00805 [Nitriliruptoraceae bacterium ZYF776]|nr:hypothetical protein [Profundirhabdus halotolerans]